jgi:hypothetical protein
VLRALRGKKIARRKFLARGVHEDRAQQGEDPGDADEPDCCLVPVLHVQRALTSDVSQK